MAGTPNLDSFDSGSNYRFGDKMLQANLKRSRFDWSHLNTLTIDNAGSLIPIMCEEVLPNSDYFVDVDCLLRVLPQVVPLYSRQRLYIYGFYARYSDLWINGGTYMSKGYSGNVVKSKPTISGSSIPDLGTYGLSSPGRLCEYLGIPIGSRLTGLNLLPFVMYFKIWQSYFMNKNLFINSPEYLPDDPSDLRVNDQGLMLSFGTLTSSSPNILDLRFRDFPQDYFTSALPFKQRGTQPILPVTINAGSSVSSPVHFSTSQSGTFTNGYLRFVNNSSDSGIPYIVGGNSSISVQLSSTSTSPGIGATGLSSGVNYGGVTLDLSSISGTSSIDLDQLRRLSISTLELERMARTDGSFEQFGLTFFGQSSRNAIDFRPVFFGSCYQNISFSEVLQTSGSDAQSPLGTYAGHGILSLSGRLGSVHTDEHGYIMLIATIMPDVYYSQGIRKKFTRLVQEEEFVPGREQVGLEPVLNKELYFSGDASVDNDVFAYQTPFDDYRYKENEIHGKIADSSNLSFFPYTQSRKFNSTPNYNKEFFTTEGNIRKDYLAAPSEVAYTAQFNIKCTAVQPLSYIGIPSGILN